MAALKTATLDSGDGVKFFDCDAAGRLVKVTLPDPDVDGTITDYLIDSYNPTGYAQVLEEWTDGVLTKTYIIGDDVLAHATATAVRDRCRTMSAISY